MNSFYRSIHGRTRPKKNKGRRKGGPMPRLHISCKCGRQQTIAPKDKPGGITFEEARAVGWKEPEDAACNNWTCPLCAGDTKNLERIFRGKK